MLGSTATAVGEPLADVLALQDQDGDDWFDGNRALRRAGDPHRRSPSSPGSCPTAREVLVTARIAARRAAAARSSGSRSACAPAAAAARLDRERSDLVATVAHELRSPLTGVKGFVQALLQPWDKLNDEQKKLMLDTVNADADRLSRLIAELLDVARIDTGRLSLLPAARPTSHVLVGRVVDVGPGRHRPRRSSYVADDELPEICVDPDKFTQVVTNLVENARPPRRGHGPA